MTGQPSRYCNLTFCENDALSPWEPFHVMQGFDKDDSTVTILLKRAGEKIRFSVNNKGSVIAREDMEHLFDRFYRAEKSRTTKGYGLGLSIAQRIVESMNGRIAVESNETEGTTFTVILSSSK